MKEHKPQLQSSKTVQTIILRQMQTLQSMKRQLSRQEERARQDKPRKVKV
jgi:hypothetical protein